MPETLKTTRPGHRLPPIELKIFKNIELCIVAHLNQYIKMTATFRNTDTNQLLLSFDIRQSQQHLSQGGV